MPSDIRGFSDMSQGLKASPGKPGINPTCRSERWNECYFLTSGHSLSDKGRTACSPGRVLTTVR